MEIQINGSPGFMEIAARNWGKVSSALIECDMITPYSAMTLREGNSVLGFDVNAFIDEDERTMGLIMLPDDLAAPILAACCEFGLGQFRVLENSRSSWVEVITRYTEEMAPSFSGLREAVQKQVLEKGDIMLGGLIRSAMKSLAHSDLGIEAQAALKVRVESGFDPCRMAAAATDEKKTIIAGNIWRPIATGTKPADYFGCFEDLPFVASVEAVIDALLELVQKPTRLNAEKAVHILTPAIRESVGLALDDSSAGRPPDVMWD